MTGMVQQPYHYSTDIEGGAPVALRFDIAGRMNVAAYLDFIAERAHWFGVAGWAAGSGAQSVTLVAAGPEAMVGALEMACTLGPLDALVEHIAAVPETGVVGSGFQIR